MVVVSNATRLSTVDHVVRFGVVIGTVEQTIHFYETVVIEAFGINPFLKQAEVMGVTR
ncbi:hypothetical protein D3C75_1297320 [compost metagenome]